MTPDIPGGDDQEMGRLHCPFCLLSFCAQHIEFRCTGELCGQSTPCPKRLDRRLLRLRQQEELPPAFAANGRRSEARCPDCGCPTRIRVCPECHSRLPFGFGRLPGRSVVVVGAEGAGKSVYLAVLVHELLQGLGSQLDLDLSNADDRTRHRFGVDYEDRLYERRRLPLPTQWSVARWNHIPPLAFELQLRTGRFGGLRRKGWFLFLYDTSGAELQASSEERMLIRCLARADGIILLLDPDQLPGVRHQSADPSTGATGTTTAEHIVRRVTGMLQAARPDIMPGQPTRLQTPIAVVLAKLDTIAHALDPYSPLHRRPGPFQLLDGKEGDAMDGEIRRLLGEWANPEVVRILSDCYDRCRCFAISALGAPPASVNRTPSAGIRPSGVEQPFLWLLGELGMAQPSSRPGSSGRRRAHAILRPRGGS